MRKRRERVSVEEERANRMKGVNCPNHTPQRNSS